MTESQLAELELFIPMHEARDILRQHGRQLSADDLKMIVMAAYDDPKMVQKAMEEQAMSRVDGWNPANG